jgi:hypothetical protein
MTKITTTTQQTKLLQDALSNIPGAAKRAGAAAVNKVASGLRKEAGAWIAQEASQIAGTASGVPVSVLYFGALIGYALMVVHVIIESIDTIRGRDVQVSEVEAAGVSQ